MTIVMVKNHNLWIEDWFVFRKRTFLISSDLRYFMTDQDIVDKQEKKTLGDFRDHRLTPDGKKSVCLLRVWYSLVILTKENKIGFYNLQ